jgi:hypothetical protein
MRISNNISTNILRDSGKTLEYIVTENTKEIFERIFLRPNSSSKSFNLIGNYGTGKSTFLWALERNLNGEQLFFNTLDDKKGFKAFEFIKIIGDSVSFTQTLANELKIDGEISNSAIIEALQKRLLKAKNKSKGLVILVDEFGKFLEFAAKNNQLEELFLLQKIAEWANNDETESYFIITLHQNFATYGKNLNSQDQLEWEKVKGRFTDLLFNEPVEQLIFFASNKLKDFNLKDCDKDNYNDLLSLIKESNLISYNNLITEELSLALFPLDWISATVLVNSLQRYGQNERSLFSFLNDKSEVSIHKRKNEFYSVSNVFDYLVYTLPSEILSPENPHKPQWSSTFKAIERAELIFDEDYKQAVEVIKTIGLSNIFTKAGGTFDEVFLSKYFQFTRGVDISDILTKLEKAGIIRYYKHSNKLNFLEGTDIDLERELIAVSKEINPDFSIKNEILNLTDFPIILAKKYSSITGTSRFFEFRVNESLENINDAEGAIDGYINLIFDFEDKEEIKQCSLNHPTNIFVQYFNSNEIRSTIFKILQLEKIISKYFDDINAKKLLKDEKDFYTGKLKDLVTNSLFIGNSNSWIYNGEEQKNIKSKKDLNELITKICFNIYPKTPYFFNELINKEFLSTPINSARKALITRLLENETIEDLGFDSSKFPPEKAIYLTLLKKTGIHRYSEDSKQYQIYAPQRHRNSIANIFEDSLVDIWEECEKFLDSCFSKNRNLNELYSILRKAPFKLKKGFIEFWIPIFLISKREEFAIFHITGGFTPYLSTETLDLIHKKPSDFSIKSYQVSGFKINLLEGYKEITQINNSANGLNTTFLAIYGNFLRFHRSLTNYSLNTRNLSPQAIRLRDSIKLSKDPEDALFNKFPDALGFYALNNETDSKVVSSYVEHLQNAISEIRKSYSDLIDEIEQSIIDSFNCVDTNFPNYKIEIKDKLSQIDLNRLTKVQRVYFERLTSPLDDRLSYIKSIADHAINKRIEDLLDEEKIILNSNIKLYSNGLLSAVEIHQFNKSSKEGKMVELNLIGENGINQQLKVVINKKYDSKVNILREQLIKELEPFTLEFKKELLVEILNQLITKDE